MSEKIILGVLTSLHKYNGIKNGKAKWVWQNTVYNNGYN